MSRTITLASSLGLDPRRFSGTPADRRLAKAIDGGLDRVEAALDAELHYTLRVADTASRYLLEAGGKRIRPVLALLTAHLGDGVTEEVVRIAAAVEITHLASLYHDDVMDDAALRRGVPSAQVVYGNSTAILTGDLLFARASLIIADLGVEALRLQGDTFERLVMGQLNETTGPEEGEDPIAHYLDVLRDKTGSLIGTAAEAGVRFSGADRALIAPLREFGEKVGVAFQLADDVLDLSADPAVTGKAAGTDLRAGVPTLPILLLRRRAGSGDAEAAALVERLAVEDDAAFAAALEELRGHAVIGETRATAHRWASEAVAALATVPAGPVKRALAEFAERVVERES